MEGGWFSGLREGEFEGVLTVGWSVISVRDVTMDGVYGFFWIKALPDLLGIWVLVLAAEIFWVLLHEEDEVSLWRGRVCFFPFFLLSVCGVSLYKKKAFLGQKKRIQKWFCGPLTHLFSLFSSPIPFPCIFISFQIPSPFFLLFFLYLIHPFLLGCVCDTQLKRWERERAWVERVVCYHMRVCEVSGPQSTCRWIVHCIYYSPSVECLCEIKLCKEFVS